MAEVVVIVDTSTPGRPAPNAYIPREPRVNIAAQSGVKLSLPWTPAGSELAGLNDTWDTLDRPGRQPLVRHNASGLPTLSFEVLLARMDGTAVDDLIDALVALGAGPQLITITGLSPREEGPWRLQSAPIRIEQRAADNAAVVRASATLSFVAAVDVSPTPVRDLPTGTGPLTGGVTKAPQSPPVATARKHTVTAGQTLWAIAITYYGTPTWQKIATANALANPNLIRPGQVLTIPA